MKAPSQRLSTTAGRKLRTCSWRARAYALRSVRRREFDRVERLLEQGAVVNIYSDMGGRRSICGVFGHPKLRSCCWRMPPT